MNAFNRREALLALSAGGVVAATGTASFAAGLPQPQGSQVGGDDPGPRNPDRDVQNPDILNPPATDAGTLPNLRFSFADAPTKQYAAGWTRQVTKRELGISKSIAGVDMRLNAGGVRELHWHKEGEWAYILYGTARVTAVDPDGRNFVGDLGPGDIWYFPSGTPHSIQGLGPDGCEFLLVFDDGGFDEDSTFLLSDWFRHIPKSILAKNFGVPALSFDHLPEPSDRYIFNLPVPGSLDSDRIAGATTVPNGFVHRMSSQTPIKSAGGTVRITDSRNFPAAKTIAAALVEIEPGGMRELHWHPNTDEWQYYIQGIGRMGVFAANGASRTFDFAAGDVGYVPFATGHYVENTGDKPLVFLEMFKSDHYADVSLNQWLALTPPELVSGHLNFDAATMKALKAGKQPVVGSA
ncbi:oxalate decarboxylase family bicupin [Phyllobacterium endophyticum]|uniref:oxalate decarboxylase family bicupin n=1 Tax=Phyllobacterium endophyticum TaxID=1149773 RepID=UPI0011C90D91|nr:oxalate decarboxylase family bicupin [Phyllobacterium endophyticum]TXR48400.1 cupin domain-containing protein [Phyllobacterium endophyticum]